MMENLPAAKLAALDAATGALVLFGYPVPLASPGAPSPGAPAGLRPLVFPRAAPPLVPFVKHTAPRVKLKARNS